MFDLKSKMYQNHALAEVNSILFTSSTVPFKDEEGEWRKSLKEGSLVDAVKIEPMMEVRCWAKAIVTKRIEPTNSNEPAKVKVTFEDDKTSYDREISIVSQDLAPRDKNSEEEVKFREELKEGSFIDCFDST